MTLLLYVWIRLFNRAPQQKPNYVPLSDTYYTFNALYISFLLYKLLSEITVLQQLNHLLYSVIINLFEDTFVIKLR